MARAKHGDYAGGLEIVRDGLALALEHDLTAVAAELYQRLSVTLYESADYRRAEEALDTALQLCRPSPDAGAEAACVTLPGLRAARARRVARAQPQMCRELIAAGTAVFVAEGAARRDPRLPGQARARRGGCSPPRSPPRRASSHYNMTVDTTAALARVAAAEGDRDEAAERCRAILARWERSDDLHYARRPAPLGRRLLRRAAATATARTPAPRR